MDWKAIGNSAALVGVLVAMVMMFNQFNERLERVHARMDPMQAETNARFDAVNKPFDTVLEAIMSFDRRVSRIEGRFDAQSAGTTE